MKKGFCTRFLALFLVAAMLPCISFSAALAENPAEGICWDFEALNWPWFYLPSTVPAEFQRSKNSFVRIYPVSGGEQEMATSVRIDFVSGDERLKDAFVIEQVSYDGEKSYPNYQINLQQVTEPGQAVFHVSCASEHYRYEKDITLRVISWDEYPLFSVTKNSDPVTVTTAPGGVVSAGMLKAPFSFEIHAGEVAKKLSGNGETVQEPFTDDIYEFYNVDTEEYCYVRTYYDDKGYPPEPEEGSKIDVLYSDRTGEAISWRFNQAGTYWSSFFLYTNSNAGFDAETAVIRVLPYTLTGPEAIAPGDSAEYTVTDLKPDSGRTFTLTLEGEGVTLTEDSAGSGVCTVSAAKDAETGTSFTLTATPSDGGAPAVLKGTVNDGVIAGIPLETRRIQMGAGFSTPVFATRTGEYESGYINNIFNQMISRPVNRNVPYWPGLTALVGGASFSRDREDAENNLRKMTAKFREGEEVTDLAEEIIDVKGEPAILSTGVIKMNGRENPFGLLFTVQNNTFLRLILGVYEGTGDAEGEMPKVTMSDMKRLAEKIDYDPLDALLTREDGAITVSAKKGETVITGGKKVQLAVSFANPDRVNKKEKNDTVEWSVIDLETGEAPADISIDKKGNLSAKKDLAAVRKLQVKAVSTTFFTEGTYEITAIPAVKKLTTDPAELFFYVGTDETRTVKAVLEPETVPPTGITWTPAKAGLLEIEAAEDGTARIRPLAGGKTTVTVKEPGGKNAKLNVSVVEPITEVVLTVKGKAQPGKAVTVTAALAPKNAGNKNLEWSLDVDESIASVDAKGKVTVSKTAPAGTVITVTCRALGAPEPVSATLEMTVE